MAERKTPDDPTPDEGGTGDPAYLARAIDASAMKAFAHPLRMQMYDYLNDRGSATATMLARHTGESTGQTSYHLRQLERHGFVTEDEGRGTGRERWWKAVGFRMDGNQMAEDASTRPAVVAVLRQQVTQRSAVLQQWFERSTSEQPEWQEASLNSRTTTTMTAREAADLNAAMMTVMHEHVEAAGARRERSADPEARRVRIYLDVIPLPRDA